MVAPRRHPKNLPIVDAVRSHGPLRRDLESGPPRIHSTLPNAAGCVAGRPAIARRKGSKSLASRLHEFFWTGERPDGFHLGVDLGS